MPAILSRPRCVELSRVTPPRRVSLHRQVCHHCLPWRLILWQPPPGTGVTSLPAYWRFVLGTPNCNECPNILLSTCSSVHVLLPSFHVIECHVMWLCIMNKIFVWTQVVNKLLQLLLSWLNMFPLYIVIPVSFLVGWGRVVGWWGGGGGGGVYEIMGEVLFLTIWLWLSDYFLWCTLCFRDHSGYGFSQWETTLYCNIVSHWLSPYRVWSPCPQFTYSGRYSNHGAQKCKCCIALDEREANTRNNSHHVTRENDPSAATAVSKHGRYDFTTKGSHLVKHLSQVGQNHLLTYQVPLE